MAADAAVFRTCGARWAGVGVLVSERRAVRFGIGRSDSGGCPEYGIEGPFPFYGLAFACAEPVGRKGGWASFRKSGGGGMSVPPFGLPVPEKPFGPVAGGAFRIPFRCTVPSRDGQFLRMSCRRPPSVRSFAHAAIHSLRVPSAVIPVRCMSGDLSSGGTPMPAADGGKRRRRQ